MPAIAYFCIDNLFHISVYYYHEVLQLFKSESYDMIVTQSERIDNEKYVLAMQSADKEEVVVPESTHRVQVRIILTQSCVYIPRYLWSCLELKIYCIPALWLVVLLR